MIGDKNVARKNELKVKAYKALINLLKRALFVSFIFLGIWNWFSTWVSILSRII
jgi:hypothetical protein